MAWKLLDVLAVTLNFRAFLRLLQIQSLTRLTASLPMSSAKGTAGSAAGKCLQMSASTLWGGPVDHHGLTVGSKRNAEEEPFINERIILASSALRFNCVSMTRLKRFSL